MARLAGSPHPVAYAGRLRDFYVGSVPFPSTKGELPAGPPRETQSGLDHFPKTVCDFLFASAVLRGGQYKGATAHHSGLRSNP